ncbi:hypothetical protein FHG87_012756 [Trinorchestia longiramus]|nr:hypothetical protein FHG87_012756 [Trinorchestia longiramus]
MSGHAQAAVPSQLPYIMGLQCSASHTLHQELPKSTYLLRTLITCRNQHSQQQSKGKKPAILSADRMGLNNPRTNKKCTLPTCQRCNSIRPRVLTARFRTPIPQSQDVCKEESTTYVIFKC